MNKKRTKKAGRGTKARRVGVQRRGSAALVFESPVRKVSFEIENGLLSIHDPDNAWRDWYSLNRSESVQLAKWILREQQNGVVSHTGALPDVKISNQVPSPGVGL